MRMLARPCGAGCIESLGPTFSCRIMLARRVMPDRVQQRAHLFLRRR